MTIFSAPLMQIHVKIFNYWSKLNVLYRPDLIICKSVHRKMWRIRCIIFYCISLSLSQNKKSQQFLNVVFSFNPILSHIAIKTEKHSTQKNLLFPPPLHNLESYFKTTTWRKSLFPTGLFIIGYTSSSIHHPIMKKREINAYVLC